MGIGGNLIWTGVFRAVSEHDGLPIAVCKRPKFTDLLSGRLYDGYTSLSEDPVFINNPNLFFLPLLSKSKPLLLRLLDRCFDALISPTFIRSNFEWMLFRKSQSLAQKNGYRLIHVDMLIHSYAEHQTKKRMIWKSGGHAMQVIAKNFKTSVKDPLPELYFTLLEAGRVKEFIDSKIGAESYIVVEPGTNKDWFGDLRSWPMDRWQELVYHIKKTYPELLVLQVGLTNTQLLEGVIDLRGKTSFREVALVIKNSCLFIGTEGGLMHAAAAVKAPSLILWGGITLPSFAGYQNHQKILSNFVSCAPCGQLGWCDNDRKCMMNLTTGMVILMLDKLLGTESGKTR